MHRYLLRFNYKGSRFSGSQKLENRKRTAPLAEKLRTIRNLQQLSSEDLALLKEEEGTVQGAIETGLEFRLKPANPAVLFLSSRTDAGVHAYNNTCSIDLKSRDPSKYISPQAITQRLNYHFNKRNLDLRINETLAVHPEFRVRSEVCSRSYVYQLCTTTQEPQKISKENFPNMPAERTKWVARFYRKLGSYTSLLPVHLKDSYLQISESKFNLEQMQEALSLMEGTHNFKAFCRSSGHSFSGKPKGSDEYVNVPRETDDFIKTMDKLEIQEVGSPLPPQLQQFQDFRFYTITINGKAFLHNQIRRMVGAALFVSSGTIQMSSIRQMLQEPEKGFNVKVRQAAPWGLFLQDIQYTQQSLASATSDVIKLPLSIPAYCFSTCENRVIDDDSTHCDTYNIDEGAYNTDTVDDTIHRDTYNIDEGAYNTDTVDDTIHRDTYNIDDGAYNTDNIDDSINTKNITEYDTHGDNDVKDANDTNYNKQINDLTETVDDKLAKDSTENDTSKSSTAEIENSDTNSDNVAISELTNKNLVEKDLSKDDINFDPSFKLSS